ncbi:MAG: A/G-specific adenine glycosylase [Bacteroidales bacterium]|nr:A/G-specific adenine glycosylase [Bacteroidales bacterium]
MHFSSRLLQWYAQNGRTLPWRQTRDPYIVWVTEILLQQTRVDQGMEYFYRFTEAFPNVASLAAAPLDEVLRLWQGLGYYSRARNLHQAARDIMEQRNGKLPESYKEWLKVKGVGPYTAAAISSIAFNEPVAALDGNVYRVLARLFAIDERIDTGRGKKVFDEVASELIDQNDPGGFNQAMMDFGATVCKPAAPLCRECIFNRECLAFLNQQVEKLPVKKPRKASRIRHFNYFYIFFENQDGRRLFFVNQRKDDDIWKNLYELPLIETSGEIKPEAVGNLPEWKEWFAGSPDFVMQGSPFFFRHLLTHQSIHARFFQIKIKPENAVNFTLFFQMVDHKRFEKMPKSKLTLSFLYKI